MKIAYVINSLDGGGAALPLADVITVMRAAGNDVFVIALMERDGRARDRLEAENIPYRVIGGTRRSYTGTTLRLQACIRDLRPDLIWTSLTHATILGQLLGALHGIPVVSWIHNCFLKPANLAILRRTKALTSHWVADSSAARDFGTDILGIDREAITCWPLFIADPGSPSAAPVPADGIIRIGSLGRLHPNKGFDGLIRAVHMLAKREPTLAARLEIVVGGEGASLRSLRDLAARLGVGSVAFAGFQHDPRQFLSGLHAYVQPSHHEGLCIAAHEAMQAGLPVIATRVGEIQHSVAASGGGRVLDFGDIEGLAETLLDVVTRPTRWAHAGMAARSWTLDRYSRERFEAQGASLLASVVAR